jgi:hypothetical protein
MSDPARHLGGYEDCKKHESKRPFGKFDCERSAFCYTVLPHPEMKDFFDLAVFQKKAESYV